MYDYHETQQYSHIVAVSKGTVRYNQENQDCNTVNLTA